MKRAKHDYLREIKALDPLKTEDLTSLVTRMLDGSPEARERLILSQLSQVVQIAREFTGMGLEEEELIAEGNCGLLQAVDDYNSTKGDFQSYIREGIKNSICFALELQAQREKDRQSLINKINSILQAIQTLTKELGRIPTEAEVAEHLKITPEELMTIMKLAGFIEEENEEPEEG